MKKIVLLIAVVMTMVSCAPKAVENETTGMTQQEATMATIMSRKSVRTFTDQPVNDSVITELLKAAMAAPTGRNIQPWHMVVLKDTSRYDEIFGDNFNMSVYKQSAFIVVMCADTTVCRPPKDNPQGKPIVQPNPLWRDDLGACTENFLLAVEAHGLGAVWTACYPYTERMAPVRKALGLPDNIIPYCVVPVGYPGGDDQPKDKWKPERIHHENW